MLRRVLLRTKTTAAISSHSDLENREIAVDGINNVFYIKDHTSNDLYKYVPISDSTSVSIYKGWTSDFCKTYIDDGLSLKADLTYVDEQLALKADLTYVDEQLALKADLEYVDEQLALKSNVGHAHDFYTDITGKPYKAILFSPIGVTPTDVSGCSYPEMNVESNIWYSSFDYNETGFWNFIIPSDYRGSIDRMTVAFYGSNVEETWELKSYVIADGGLIATPTLLSTKTLTGSTDSTGKMVIFNDTSASAFFGTSSNINKYSIITIRKTSVGSSKFAYLKLEYI